MKLFRTLAPAAFLALMSGLAVMGYNLGPAAKVVELTLLIEAIKDK